MDEEDIFLLLEDSSGSASDHDSDFNVNEDIAVLEDVRPTSSNDSSRSTSPQTMKKGKKRTQQPKKWKRNVKKSKRNSGEQYKTLKNKLVASKCLGNPCQCALKCFDTVGLENCRKIHSEFWSLGDFNIQNAHISGCVTVTKPKRVYTEKGADSRRKATRQFHVYIQGLNVKVCKVAFLSMHSISNGRLIRILDKKATSSVGQVDQRGLHDTRPNKIKEPELDNVRAHINRFPRRESHYSRADNANKRYLSPDLNIATMYKLYTEEATSVGYTPVSEYMYRHIFNHEFNLSFTAPRTDTCKICDELKVKIDAADTPHIKQQYEEKKELHLAKAQAAFDALKSDTKKCKENPAYATLCFDLQQALPTPLLRTSVIFYLRQLWTYNLGVHNMSDDRAYMYLWSENVAGRGADEIISCLMKQVEKIPDTVKNVIFYSDSCAGQNKNFAMVTFWLQIIHSGRFESIEHKFLLPGHTYLPCDRDFGLIEKQKKKVQYLYIPEEWIPLIKKARTKSPFDVCWMQVGDFKSMAPVLEILKRRQKATTGEPIEFRNIMWMRFEKSCPPLLQYSYKWSHDANESWKQVDVSKSVRGRPSNAALANTTLARLNLPQKYDSPRPIKAAKLRDLKSILEFVPPVHHAFYTSLIDTAQTKSHEVDEVDEDDDILLDYDD